MVKQYIDVDSIMKNDEFAQWYERLRKAGFAFLLLNLAYLLGYMCFRVISEFTISSFLFGYFVQMICNVTTYITDTLRSNENEIRNYVEKQVGNWIGTIKIAVDYINTHFEEKSSSSSPSSFASSSKLSYVSQEPPTVSSSTSSVSTPSRPPVTISLSGDSLTVKNNVEDSTKNVNDNTSDSTSYSTSDQSSDSTSDQSSDSTNDNIQTTSANINLNIDPRTTTTINLDPSIIEYLLRRNEAENALMHKVFTLNKSVIEPSIPESTSHNDEDDTRNQIKHIDSELSISDCNSCDVSDNDSDLGNDKGFHSSNDESQLSQSDDDHIDHDDKPQNQ
jgi:hypothetical protein